MAFKSLTQYNDERYAGLFRLPDDGDSADVIFLYRSIDDVVVCDSHYVKSSDYSGYVMCNGQHSGCPACDKGIRIQTKLFIPMYNLSTNEVEIWDRNVRFENQLVRDVFNRYPNPSECIFRITRHGRANDINTTYQIQAIGRNTVKSYNDILTSCNIKMPDVILEVSPEKTNQDLRAMLNSEPSGSADDLVDYAVVPRVATQKVEEEDVSVMIPTDDLSDIDSLDDDISEDPTF